MRYLARLSAINALIRWVQEVVLALRQPVLFVRETTMRPDGEEAGAARLAVTEADRIVTKTLRPRDEKAEYVAMVRPRSSFGGGHAARRIV